ncbi:MAG: zf-HC2 domain-containing protein [Planctomycetes bacterium]|nr:zf-HC2 domain-containing protein [Planctomycetota bacterium]
MSCKDHENDLLAFLDRRLDASGAAKVEAHIKGCPACSKEASAMRETWRLLGYYPGRNVSGQLPARLLEAARLQLEVERRWTHKLRRHLPIIASAAIVLLAFGVTMMLGPGFRANSASEYERVISQLPADEQAVVQNLDLYENLDTVQNMDVLEDNQSVEYIDLLTSLSDEDF